MTLRELLSTEDYRLYRENIDLLLEQIRIRFDSIRHDARILEAIGRVPRHLFVGVKQRALAYTDRALPTMGSMTTSAPSLIAEMIELSGVRSGDRVLEVGTGLGYEAAVLAELGARVHSIEIDGRLAEIANRALVSLGYKHDKTADGERGVQSLRRYHEVSRGFSHRGIVDLYEGNGLAGLPDNAPFRAVIVAAAAPHLGLLRALMAQISPNGGRLVVPVGRRGEQTLSLVERTGDQTTVRYEHDRPVSFGALIET